MASTPYQWIADPAALAGLAGRLAGGTRLVLDTEFVWERTYHPNLGLVQAALPGGACFLLDTVAAPDLSPLAAALADPAIEKILHDAPQDLMILKRASGAAARRVFDTRVAAGFAGLDSTISLQNLLAEALGVSLPKGHTRTDWTARPLSPQQLEYAVDDVVHMIPLADALRARARDRGVEAWLDAEMAELYDRAEYGERPAEESYLRLRAASFLPRRNLAVLRELAAWRERMARERNLPRGFIMPDPELSELAQVLPRSEADLDKCRILHPKAAKRHGPVLVELVKRGLGLPEERWPAADDLPDEREIGKDRLHAFVARIKEKALERKIDYKLVATKAEVLRLLAEKEPDPARHRLLRGWRAELLA